MTPETAEREHDETAEHRMREPKETQLEATQVPRAEHMSWVSIWAGDGCLLRVGCKSRDVNSARL